MVKNGNLLSFGWRNLRWSANIFSLVFWIFSRVFVWGLSCWPNFRVPGRYNIPYYILLPRSALALTKWNQQSYTPSLKRNSKRKQQSILYIPRSWSIRGKRKGKRYKEQTKHSDSVQHFANLKFTDYGTADRSSSSVQHLFHSLWLRDCRPR